MLDPLLYWFELDYEVQAPEKLDKNQPYVVVMNHQHSLDSAAAAKVYISYYMNQLFIALRLLLLFTYTYSYLLTLQSLPSL